jgi:universal stress protein A
MSRIKRVLVPTDFSPTSELATQYAIDIAPPGASIHVLHVVDDAGLLASYPEGQFVDFVKLRAELMADAERNLEEAMTRFAAPQAVVTTEVVMGRPVAQIVATAKTRHADLIVMGTHGRGAIAHLVLGSVAERVLRAAHCPVLAVRDDSRAADTLAEELLAHRLAAHI